MSLTQTLAATSSQHGHSHARGRQDASPASSSSHAAAADPDTPALPATAMHRKLETRLTETIRHFWDLGCTAFGGPGVHVVILRRRFVDRLKWLDDTTFTQLFALCNALPGPASTKLTVTIATIRNGTSCGILAFLFWSLPGAAGMAGIGAAVRSFPETLPPIVLALLTGLNASAVGLIALAAYQLSLSSVTDKITRLLVLGSASFGICYHAPWMYPCLIAAGGIITLAWDTRKSTLSATKRVFAGKRASAASIDSSASEQHELDNMSSSASQATHPSPKPFLRSRGAVNRTVGTSAPIPSTATASTSTAAPAAPASALAESAAAQSSPIVPTYHLTDASLMVMSRTSALVLGASVIASIIAIVVTRAEVEIPPRWLDFFANMLIAGVIIFGGGPVVVPLLRGYTVTPGWVDSRDFLLGFAILQAFPGPNFNFAVYLGVLAVPKLPALGATLGFIGIFAPGILLMIALLPLYDSWRRNWIAKSVLRGLNAAATGLVYVAVWQLFLVGYIYTAPSSDSVTQISASGPLTTDPFWGVVAACAFVATQWFGSPPPATIAGGALAGLSWYGVVGPAGTHRQPSSKGTM